MVVRLFGKASAAALSLVLALTLVVTPGIAFGVAGDGRLASSEAEIHIGVQDDAGSVSSNNASSSRQETDESR